MKNTKKRRNLGQFLLYEYSTKILINQGGQYGTEKNV